MTVRTPDSGLESLERRYESLARVIQYVLLAVPLIPYVLVFRPSAGAFAITVGVAVAAGAWITWATILHPGWVERPWLSAGLHRRPDRVRRRAHRPQSLFRVLHLDRVPARVPVPAGCVALGRRRGDSGLLCRGAGRRIPPADHRVAGGHLARAGLRRRDARGSVRPARGENRGTEPGPEGDDRRAGPGQPAAGGDDNREHRPAGSAADPGQGGGRRRRAAADGPGDPRHAGPGPDRHHHPARGRPADRARRRARPPHRQRHPAGPRQPGRGPPLGAGAAAAGPGERQVPRGAGPGGGPLVGHQRRAR